MTRSLSADSCRAGRIGAQAFMTRRKLPIGIQTFREIREENHYYVDKTAYAQRMVEEGKHYFLSRPRRFGKSLLVDTLKELFEGNEPLFRGLHVHDGWDWSARHPVLRLSFGGGNFTEPGHLHANLMAQLRAIERRTGARSDHATGPERLGSLIEALREDAGRRVAVLVDEYDKPILDALDVPDVARANREYLRALYSVIKDRDADVRFAFLTGVSSIGANLISQWSRRILSCGFVTRRPARWTRTGMCCCRSSPETGGSWRRTPGR